MSATKNLLSKAQAEKVLQADIANIVGKVQNGKPLTSEQRAVLLRWTDGDQTGEAKATAKNYTALAKTLGISRRSITSWKRRKGAPTPATNGTHSVTEWKLFLKGQGLMDGDDDEAGDSSELVELKKRDLKAKAEEREFKLEILRKEYLHKDDVRESITLLVQEAMKLLRDKFENELPSVCAGLDAVRIRAENSAAIDEVCNILHSGG